jgi:hypothetical protein
MEVEYDQTEEDLVAFLRYMRANPATPGGRVLKRFVPWPWIALLLLLGGVKAYFGLDFLGNLFAGPVGYLLVFGFGWIGSSWFVRFWTSPRKVVRNVLKDEPLAYQDLRFALNPLGVTQTSFFGTHTRYWRGVRRIVTTADYAIFYISKNSAFCVPNRAFASERDFQIFVETARRYHAEALSPAAAFSVREDRGELARSNDPPDPGITRPSSG